MLYSLTKVSVFLMIVRFGRSMRRRLPTTTETGSDSFDYAAQGAADCYCPRDMTAKNLWTTACTGAIKQVRTLQSPKAKRRIIEAVSDTMLKTRKRKNEEAEAAALLENQLMASQADARQSPKRVRFGGVDRVPLPICKGELHLLFNRWKGSGCSTEKTGIKNDVEVVLAEILLHDEDLYVEFALKARDIGIQVAVPDSVVKSRESRHTASRLASPGSGSRTRPRTYSDPVLLPGFIREATVMTPDVVSGVSPSSSTSLSDREYPVVPELH